MLFGPMQVERTYGLYAMLNIEIYNLLSKSWEFEIFLYLAEMWLDGHYWILPMDSIVAFRSERKIQCSMDPIGS